MSHPSELELSMYADALEGPAIRRLESHLEDCAACRSAVSGLTAERASLTDALQQEEPVRIPPLRASRSPRRLLGTAAAAAGISVSIATAWILVTRIALPAPLALLHPALSDGLVDLGVALVAFILSNGAATWTAATQTAGVGALLLFAAAGALILARKHRSSALLVAAVLAAVLVAPMSHALEIRHSEQLLTIPSSETIDDTLIAGAESISIDGTVNGDVIAAARRIVVRGHITGLLIAAADSVEIEGRVDGSAAGFARDLDVTAAQLGSNLYGFGQRVTVGRGADVVGNAIVFARTAELAAPIGRDATSFAQNVEVSDSVAGDLRAFGETVTVLGPARIGGDVIAHVPEESDLRIAPGATVAGTVRTEPTPAEARAGRPGVAWSVAVQIVRFAAAIAAGLLVLWILPSLRSAYLESGVDALIAAGVGLLALVCVPVVAIVVGITIIGLPIALTGLALWLAAVYFAKILFAHFLGRVVLRERIEGPHFALALAVGLALVLIVINIPFIGGLLNLILTLVGLGMLVEQIYHLLHRRSEAPL
jgi:cytoskeletal protein CcmA (bactofilin family)